MGAPRGPTLRAQWLGQQLRQLREDGNFHLKEAAGFLQRDPSTLSRFESGEYPIRRPDLMALLDLYRVDDEQRRATLLRLGEEVWQTGWWEGYAEELTPALIDFTWLEERATAIRSFDPLALPGLLQTREYAKTVIEAADPQAASEQVERWVDFRMRRQVALDRDDAPQLSSIVSEAVLRTHVGGPDVMRAQLTYLLETKRRAQLDLRVLPLSAGAHPSPDGSFRIVEMPEPYPDVVHVSTPAGALYVETDGVPRFVRTYDRLREMSLEPTESAALIEEVVHDLR